jgi:mono/diheme cytochrome c family protein
MSGIGKGHLLGILAAALCLSTAGAQEKKKPTTPAPAPDGSVSYAKQVYPILNDRCQPCHYPKDKKGGLDVSTFAAVMKGGKTKNLVVAGDPDKSFLIKEIVGKDPPMPKNANPLTTPQIDLITKWIKEGARNN